jgi:RND family efflux transporter MFP subunit
MGLAVCLGIMMLSACSSVPVEDAGPVVRPVKTIVVGGALSTEMSFPGIVDAGEKAILSFRVSGRLQALPIDEGQEIKQGDLIAQLDPRDFEIARERATAEFQKSEADLNRYQRLYEREAIPLSDLELRRSQRDVAKAQLDEARRNQDYTRLVAPFSGQIGRRYVENFMDVTPQQDIVDLNDTRNMEVQVDIPESLAKGMREGMQAQAVATFTNQPGKEYPLTFKEAASRADAQTQTFKVRLRMPQPEEFSLLPGMTADVLVRLSATETASMQQDKRIVLPAVAVVGAPDNSGFVWVVDDASMTVSKRTVRLGQMVGSDQVLVLEGLTGGERVVTAGISALSEGMQVRLWERQS